MHGRVKLQVWKHKIISSTESHEFQIENQKYEHLGADNILLTDVYAP